VFAPLLILVFWIGFYPNPVLSRIQPSIEQSLTLIRTRELRAREYDAREAMVKSGVEPCCPESKDMSAAQKTLQGGVR